MLRGPRVLDGQPRSDQRGAVIQGFMEGRRIGGCFGFGHGSRRLDRFDVRLDRCRGLRRQRHRGNRSNWGGQGSCLGDRSRLDGRGGARLRCSRFGHGHARLGRGGFGGRGFGRGLGRRRRRGTWSTKTIDLAAAGALQQVGALDFLGRENVLTRGIGTGKLFGHGPGSSRVGGGTARVQSDRVHSFHYLAVALERKRRLAAATGPRCPHGDAVRPSLEV